MVSMLLAYFAILIFNELFFKVLTLIFSIIEALTF